MIRTKDVSFKYDGSTVIDFPDLEVKANERMAILGDSGKGKTTLLYMLCGILKPTSGTVFYDNQDIAALNESKRDQLRAREMGLVFQENVFLKALTIIENIVLSFSFSGQKTNLEVIRNLARDLDIESELTKKPSELSVGQLQRASIVRALVHEPKLLLVDEPTSALDDRNCEQVVQLLRRSAENTGAALVVITHDHRLRSMFEADETYQL